MVTAIVLAAGVGSRMNSKTPKQFLILKDKEIIFYALDVFQNNTNIDNIILVTGEDYIDYCRENVVEKYSFSKVKSIIAGGKERYDSVHNGLVEANALCENNAANENDGNIVIIHDGARPFVTDKMINDSIECIKKGNSGCTVAVAAKDTIKICKKINDQIVSDNTPDRSTLYQIQTPQTFNCNKLMTAYEKMMQDKNHKITDDTMLMEQYMGEACIIIEGSYKNIKITTPEDLEIGEIFAR